MTYTVLVGTDAIGQFTILLHGDEVSPAGQDYRFRLVGQTDDYAEAARMVQTERGRIEEGPDPAVGLGCPGAGSAVVSC